ncbi:MAG: hypothetical protein OEY24_08790 [Candidatus Bathyarchaeota archaeon]|nr:hypothetical protein [Candidatus Bathyarchaeota archaeon]MDH5495779.1 hypothetical protein [Candidatus Bathyarchaeota archaeon]
MKKIEENRQQLDNAEGYSEVWEIAKDNVKAVLKQQRQGMMLFLDDMPLRLGAYHPLGTNNIVLNRALVQIVEATTKSRKLLNAFVYTILLHEYLHALGYIPEAEVRPLVYKVSKTCFGEEHVAARLAKSGPWSLLRGLPLDALKAPKRVMEIVKDFEKTNQRYIV